MKHLYLLLVVCLMSSCTFFQMERRTSDVILEEELQAIEWDEVDVYPMFSNCKTFSKSEQLVCFVSSLHDKITHGLQRFVIENPMDSIKPLNIQITIDKDKELSFTIASDTTLFISSENLLLLSSYLRSGLDSLTVVEPALKRGIPVTTEFILPIHFTYENDF